MLHSIIQSLQDFVMFLIDTMGSWGIFLAMLIESVCIPLPSEVIMLFGGFMAESGVLNFWMVIIAGIAGNLVGSLLAYYIGKKGGRTLVLKFGKYIFLNVKHLDKAELWFNRYGASAVFFGRVLPVIRTFISLPAGIAKMNLPKFIIYTILGCIPWNIFLAWLGYTLGANWGIVEEYTRPISYAILALCVVFVIWLAYKIWNKKARKETSKPDESSK
ncbi:DedA family protein [Listeria costaricensis]|uniref:DedA family protein n=1 Tax=Listeria costaricensis TaxID=2026604 RepID=UPI000C08C4F3|nr:DedA family protein [Listeria costaricensis]